MPHIVYYLYDSEGNQIGEYHPGHGEEPDAPTEPILTFNTAAFAAALDAEIAKHPDRDGITLTFKAKA